jgi:hypothetical protein
MALLEGARLVLVRRLQWSGLLGSLAGNAEGEEGYELDTHGLPQIRHLQEKLDKRILFPQAEILLTLGLLFHRAAALGTGMKGRARNLAMVRKSTIRSRHDGRKTLRQHPTSLVHGNNEAEGYTVETAECTLRHL